MRKISKRKNTAFRRSFTSEVLDGIVIQKDDRGAEVLTANYIDVRAPLCAAGEGDAVKVKITEVTDRETNGEIVPPLSLSKRGA